MASKKLRRKLLVKICLVGTVLLSLYSWSYPQVLPGRSISVKIVTDEEFKAGLWQPDAILAQLALVSDRFFNKFGIRLEVTSSGSWQSDNGPKMLMELFEDRQRKVAKSDCDVVLGVTGQINLDKNYLGAASYLDGYMLLQKAALTCSEGRTLEHEVAHLFGAVDLDEPLSFMNRKRIGGNYNDFLEQIILVHKDRSFDDLRFPLPQERWQDAIELYTNRKQLNREELDLNVMLSLFYFEQKDYQAVEKECQDIIRKNPRFPEAYNLFGIALAQQGRYNEAILKYDKAIQMQPHRHKLHYNLGIVYMKQQRHAAAIECFRKAIEIHPCFARAYSNLGIIHMQRGDISSAIEEFKLTVTLDRNSSRGYYDLASAYLYLGDEKSAKTECRKAINLDPESPEPYNLLGLIMECTGKSKDAEAAYLRAVELAPNHFDANLNLGHFYIKSQSWDESIQHYWKVLELKPDFPLVYINLAVVYYHKGKFQDAWDCVEKARILGMDPNPEFEQRLILAVKKKDLTE